MLNSHRIFIAIHVAIQFALEERREDKPRSLTRGGTLKSMTIYASTRFTCFLISSSANKFGDVQHLPFLFPRF